MWELHALRGWARDGRGNADCLQDGGPITYVLAALENGL